MANTSAGTELELIKLLGERMSALAKLSTEHVNQLAARSALLARMFTETVTQFNRDSELATRISERIQARPA
jgi:hypothetical protein